MKNIVRPMIITACLLAIPLIAMQFTNEVVWTVSDFIIMGVLIFGICFAYEFVSGRSNKTIYKVAAGLTALTTFLLMWVNLAVGIIGDDNPANLLYLGVVAIVFLGSIAVRFEPQQMSHVLFVAAVAQMIVPTIAFAVWRPDFSPGVIQVFALNAVFSMFWTGAGLLFRNASIDSE